MVAFGSGLTRSAGAPTMGAMTDKIRVERSIAHLPDYEPLPQGWRTTSLAELGEERFAAAMLRASEGDSFDQSTPESALDDLRELIEAAGPAFVPERWVVVSDDDSEIGVVLPQTFPDHPEVGTIFYLGVVPERRGQGAGRRLHRYGMGRLRAVKAERYVDSTDPRNEAMRAVFRANGCHEVDAIG